MSRARTWWTAREVALMRQLRAGGASRKLIAETLGRSEKSVKAQLERRRIKWSPAYPCCVTCGQRIGKRVAM